MLRSIFWPVLAPAFLYACGSGALTPVIVLAAMSLGAGHAAAGAIVTADGLASVLLAVPAGYVIHALGERRSMTLATLLAAVLTAVCVGALVTHHGTASLLVFAVAVVAVGGVEVVWSLARQAYIADTVRTSSLALAMTSLGGAGRAGQLVGPLIASLLLLWFPLFIVFVMHIVLALAATALIVGSHRRADRRPAPPPRPAREQTSTVRWRAVALAGVAMLALSMARQGKAIVVPLWGDHLHLTASAISLAVAFGSAVELVLLIPGGILKDRLGRAGVLIACMAMLGIGFGLMPLGGTLPWFAAGIAVASIGNGLGSGINMTIGADLSPSIGRAKFLGYWATISQTGSLAGPGLVTLVIATSGLPLAVGALACAPILGAVWMIVFRRRIGLPTGASLRAGRGPAASTR